MHCRYFKLYFIDITSHIVAAKIASKNELEHYTKSQIQKIIYVNIEYID